MQTQIQRQTQTQKPREFGFRENRQLPGTIFTKYKDRDKYKHKYKDKDKHENHESLCSVNTGGSWGSPSWNININKDKHKRKDQSNLDSKKTGGSWGSTTALGAAGASSHILVSCLLHIIAIVAFFCLCANKTIQTIVSGSARMQVAGISDCIVCISHILWAGEICFKQKSCVVAW